jgi:hypothetical protein
MLRIALLVALAGPVIAEKGKKVKLSGVPPSPIPSINS